jgi:hypothetical protein
MIELWKMEGWVSASVWFGKHLSRHENSVSRHGNGGAGMRTLNFDHGDSLFYREMVYETTREFTWAKIFFSLVIDLLRLELLFQSDSSDDIRALSKACPCFGDITTAANIFFLLVGLILIPHFLQFLIHFLLLNIFLLVSLRMGRDISHNFGFNPLPPEPYSYIMIWRLVSPDSLAS